MSSPFYTAARKFIASIQQLVYPSFCLHCKKSLLDFEKGLCNTCLSTMELLVPEERCRRCFGALIEEKCMECGRGEEAFDRIFCAFSYEGPAKTLVQEFKFKGKSYLGKALAAYLVFQWERAGGDFPDFVVPVPMLWSRKWLRGYNQSQILADAFAALLEVPLFTTLYRRGKGVHQASLSKEKREEFLFHDFFIKKKELLEGKKVLIIDDVITTGATVSQLAETLWEASPKSIEVAGLCKTPKLFKTSKL